MIDILEEPEVRREVHPLSLPMYHSLRDAGLLEANVELIEGTLIRKMSKSPLHSLICQRLVEWLRTTFEGKQVLIRQEQPLTLANSEPEPDVSVVEGVIDDFASSHPSSALLVAEVAITSRKIDEQKARIYAAAGVREYWLFLPENSAVRVHSEPVEDDYLQVCEYGSDDTWQSKIFDSQIEGRTFLG